MFSKLVLIHPALKCKLDSESQYNIYISFLEIYNDRG